jgi:hypothetical protein
MLSALLTLGLELARAASQAPDQGAGQAASAVQRVVGEVTSIDAAAHRISLKTDAGGEVVVTTDDKTSFLRTQPGARDLSGAERLTFAEIAVGDRLLARGSRAADGKTLAARQAVVMSRSDIARKREQERAEWRRRGLAGVIKAVDAARQQITVEARSLTGSQAVVVDTTERKASFKRYAPDSVHFSDAVPGSFADLQPGDQVRVLGDRTADGSRMVAEQVVSGTFQIVSGAVKSVSGREVTIVDNATGKPLVVVAASEAMVRRLPPDLAARLSRGGRSRMAREQQEGGSGQRARTNGGATLYDVLERLPALPLDELKPGDQIALSTPKGRASRPLTAVVVLTGIEPLLQPRSRGTTGEGEVVGLSPEALDLGLGVP